MSGIGDNHELLILHLNTNGLGREKWKAKNDQLKKFMRKYDFDIMGLTEINVHWPLLPLKDQWQERSLGWWEMGLHSSKAFNTEDESPTATQPGGCMLLSTNKAKWKIISNGRDFRNLGRWAWTRYRGKDGVVTERKYSRTPNCLNPEISPGRDNHNLCPYCSVMYYSIKQGAKKNTNKGIERKNKIHS